MKVWEYKSYEEYVEKQTYYNKQKINWVYVKDHAIATVCDNHPYVPNKILCHGTRNGAELSLFAKKVGIVLDTLIGTEISDTAEQFKNTVQWDFAIPKREWIGVFDIVYSNSFDHSYDPKKTLETWRDQLNSDGRLYLDYSERWSVCQESDPVDATLEEVITLMTETGLEVVDKLRGSQGGTILSATKK